MFSLIRLLNKGSNLKFESKLLNQLVKILNTKCKKTKRYIEMIQKMTCLVKQNIVDCKRRHPQSQGSNERGNQDMMRQEKMVAIWI